VCSSDLGKTLGHKGWVPMGVSAMLGSAGLAEGDVEQVKVGYDPTILPRGQVDALVGFISNEPGQLEAAGEDVTVWEPKDFGIPGSIGSYAINPAFGESHPTAVEDFLRAVFHAYEYCAAEEHVEECIELQHEQAGPDSDPEHETAVWTKEVSVIADNPLPGGFGVPDLDNVGALAGLISEYGGLAVDAEEAQGWFTTAFAEAVVEDGQAIWPAP
jgi:NitT/TauT family transport system substrate-binding protein